MSVDGKDVPDPEFQIDDPEELSQTKRISEILSRRSDVLEARNRAMDESLMGDVTQQEAIAHYHSRLQTLILDLWTKFVEVDETEEEVNEEDMELGERYLKREHIDSITVPPPEEMRKRKTDLAAGETQPDPETVDITGLEWFIENQPVVQAEFTAYSWNPPGMTTAHNQRWIPMRTLDKALIYCMKFVDNMGIDADLEQEQQVTKIDRDILEEYEQWREDNT